MTYFKTLLRFLLSIFLGFVAFVIVYLLAAFWLPSLKVNRGYVPPKEGITIYIESNGVHTDFVLPVRTDQINWFGSFPPSDFERVDSSYSFVAIGWGDKGFYLDTKTWADLKFSIAFKAVFALGSTAMHVSYYPYQPELSSSCKKIILSRVQYSTIISYILSSFKLKNNKPDHIRHEGYGKHDTFYEANGTYSLFKTCNIWTSIGLKTMGIRTGIWSPFERGIMDNL